MPMEYAKDGEVIDMIKEYISDFEHIETGRSLDRKM